MADYPTFQLPDSMFSIADWLLTDPTSNQSVLPFFDQAIQKAEGATVTAPHWQSVTIAGTPHTIGTRSVPLEMARLAAGTDLGIQPYLDWFSSDPRSAIQQNVLANYNAALADPLVQGNPLNLGKDELGNLIQGGVIKEAFRQRMNALGVAPDSQQTFFDTFFPMTGNAESGYGAFVPNNVPKSSPLYGLGQSLVSDWGYNPLNPLASLSDPNYGFSYSNAGLQQLFKDAGLTINSSTPPGVTTNTLPGGSTVASNSNGGVQPSTLNYMAPFLSLLAGGYGGFDANGNPTWTPLNGSQWASVYGGNGLFGPAQADQIKDLLNPLPLSQQEQAARDITSTDPAVRDAAIAKYPELAQALSGFNNTVLPALQGQMANTIPLYLPEQYAAVRDLRDTGRRPQLEQAGTTYMTRQVAPQLAAAYGGQLGTSGSDFGGELANQSRLFSADIANAVNANQNLGLGMLNDMTNAQGLYDTNRLATMAPLYQTALTAAAQLPLSYSQDLANLGGAFRQTDELLRPGNRILDLYRTLLTGASPSNLGYVAQGQTPSATSSLLNGLAGQSANYSGGWLNGLASNFTQGVGSSVLSNLFSGGGLDNNGSMGLLGDLGGLLSGVGSSIWSGLSGLFGNSGSGGYDWSNPTGDRSGFPF